MQMIDAFFSSLACVMHTTMVEKSVEGAKPLGEDRSDTAP